MTYQVGDKVVHWAFGPGEIIQLDEKRLAGKTAWYYGVLLKDMTIWVPIGEAENHSLRQVTPAIEFERLYDILRSVGDLLPEDRIERKGLLNERLRGGTLDDVCRVIRDLNSLSYKKKLNENDLSTMERARKLLLDEWKLSMSIPMEEAQRKLDFLLEEGRKFVQISD